jgi:hypothetical protein
MTILGGLTPSFNLISLLVLNIDYYKEYNSSLGFTQTSPLLRKLDHRAWGAVGYLISRDYAMKVIATYDRPFFLCQPLLQGNRLTSEVITMNSNGYATSIPLVVDEMSQSDINGGNDKFHKTMFDTFGLNNYDL